MLPRPNQSSYSLSSASQRSVYTDAQSGVFTDAHGTVVTDGDQTPQQRLSLSPSVGEVSGASAQPHGGYGGAYEAYQAQPHPASLGQSSNSAYPAGVSQPPPLASGIQPPRPLPAHPQYPTDSAAIAPARTSSPPVAPTPLYAAVGPGAATQFAPPQKHVSVSASSTPPPPPPLAASTMHHTKNGSITTAAKSATSRSVPRSGLDVRNWINSRAAAAFLGTIIVEAIVVIVMISLVFSDIESRTPSQVAEIKTVAVYLSIFLFGMIFAVVIALDANRLRNTIQVIGVCVFNAALIVTAALEISQVREALTTQDNQGFGIPCKPGEPRLPGSGGRCSALESLFPRSRRYLIVVPVIVGVAQLPLTILAYYLWSRYGWDVYTKIGADIKMRKRYLIYQVYVVFLKFDFFFGVAFTMAYLILVSNRNDAEYALTIAAIPCAIVILFLAAFAAHKELRSVMAFSITCFFAGAGYFIYKITRIYAPSTEAAYRSVRRTLTFFSVFATVCLFASIVLAILCLLNFGKGLLEAHRSVSRLSSSLHARRASGMELQGGGAKAGMGAKRKSDMTALQMDEASTGAGSRVAQSATRRSLD